MIWNAVPSGAKAPMFKSRIGGSAKAEPFQIATTS